MRLVSRPFLVFRKSQQTKQKYTKVNIVEDEKTDNLDGIVDMSHRCVDIETTKREKKRGGYNFTLKVACFSFFSFAGAFIGL